MASSDECECEETPSESSQISTEVKPPKSWCNVISRNATLISMILLQLTGLVIAKHIYDLETAQDVSMALFLSELINGYVWLHYAIHAKNQFAFITYAIVVFANFFLFLFYFSYSPDKIILLAYMIAIIAMLLTSFFYMNRALPVQEITPAAGSFALFVSFILLIFPLMHLRQLLTEEVLPNQSFLLPRLAMLVITHFLYLWYGIHVKDQYIELVSSLSFLVSAIILIAFLIKGNYSG